MNYDETTGIYYGVISQNSVMQAWADGSEPDYGEPHCPECGDEPNTRKDFDYEAECGVYLCDGCQKVWYPMELNELDSCPECGETCYNTPFRQAEHSLDADYACHWCHLLFGSDVAYGDEAIGFYVDDGVLQATTCLDSDIMVLKSPYYTIAPPCSPCVPQAGNLDDAARWRESQHHAARFVAKGIAPASAYMLGNSQGEGRKTYCLDHGWFEGGIAPYPVFRVDNNVEVKAERVNVPCPTCSGIGIVYLSILAKRLNTTQDAIKKRIETSGTGKVIDHRGVEAVNCWRCYGSGTIDEVKITEGG